MPTINLGSKKRKPETDINRIENRKRHNDPRYKPMKVERLMRYPICEICGLVHSDGIVHKVHYPSNEPLTSETEAAYYNVDNVLACCDQCRRDYQKRQQKETHEKRQKHK